LFSTAELYINIVIKNNQVKEKEKMKFLSIYLTLRF
jgi:hypothetical protein